MVRCVSDVRIETGKREEKRDTRRRKRIAVRMNGTWEKDCSTHGTGREGGSGQRDMRCATDVSKARGRSARKG